MIAIKNILYTTIIFLTFLVILELLTRSTVFLVKGPEKVRRDVIADEKFGWVHTVHAKKKIRKNKCGETVVRLPPRHKLINKFPKYPEKKNILFIGDSVTHAHEVSTGKAYYDVFEEKMKNKYSVYAAGIGGFGNLQEYMVLETIYNNIKPDIVIWQLCGNDIANNVYDLDNSTLLNNQRPRPYYNLENGQIEIKDPGFWLFDISLGFRFVFLRLVMLDSKYNLGILNTLDSLIALNPQEIKKHENQGLKVLSVLLNKAVSKFPGATFYGFAVAGKNDDQLFEEIFKNAGAYYLSEFSDYVSKTEGTNCAPLDGHWNHLGNQIAGNMLSEFLSDFDKNKEKHQ